MTGLRNIPSVLSFSKKLIPSDGLFSGTSQQPGSPVTPLIIQLRTVRGTFAFRRKDREADERKIFSPEIHDPNIQHMDCCMLGPEQDVLILRFSLKITGGLPFPAACNNERFRQCYQAVIMDYLEREGCREPARRYAHNIAGGRFLWRNLVGAGHIDVVVDNLSAEKKQRWVFDAGKYSLRHFEQADNLVDDLGEQIAAALSCDEGALLLAVTARVRTGKGQDFYTLFEKWVSGKKLPVHEENYVVAVLIRGGVFGGGG